MGVIGHISSNLAIELNMDPVAVHKLFCWSESKVPRIGSVFLGIKKTKKKLQKQADEMFIYQGILSDISLDIF